MSVTKAQTADFLEKTLDTIKETGWVAGSWRCENGKVCLYGGALLAAGVKPIHVEDVADALVRYWEVEEPAPRTVSTWEWNESVDSVKETVRVPKPRLLDAANKALMDALEQIEPGAEHPSWWNDQQARPHRVYSLIRRAVKNLRGEP